MQKPLLYSVIILLLTLLEMNLVYADDPAPPYINPSMADSTVYETHTRGRYTSIAGPAGPGRQLLPEEIVWKPVGPNNAPAPLYSSPYPNGKRVIWVGGYDRVAKLDANSLVTLATYAIGDTQFFTAEETQRHLGVMNKLNVVDRLTYTWNLMEESERQSLSFYRMLSSKNEFYLPHTYKDGSVSLRVYGEIDSSDPSSAIEFRREWRIPSKVSTERLFGMTMTGDGWLVLAFSDGKLVALSEDFNTYHVVTLPRTTNNIGKKRGETGIFDTFLRNGVVVDDQNGIYVVTRDYMQRIQWTGDKLSLEPADGAWKAAYPNDSGLGSGSTPALMGWGKDEDHLVVIADGSRSNNLMAFWRDEIPEDWTGLAGMDSRIAGIEPVDFGLPGESQIHIENSIVVYGYGAFLNSFPIEFNGLPEGVYSATYGDKVLSRLYLTNEKGFEPYGNTMIRWNPNSRQLETAWISPLNTAMSLCTPSAPRETLYCWGAREGEWTMEALDWNTGKSLFHYTLGKDQRFNVVGGTITVAPDGAIDCGCQGGLGMVRINLQ